MGKLEIILVLVVLATTSLSTTTEAQTTQDCGSKLVPCYNYLTTNTTPPASCCDPVKETVATQLTCLCTLYNTPGFLDSLNITLAQALRIPQACGLNSSLSACTNATAPASSVTPPPAVAGNDGGISSGKIAWTGILSLFLLCISITLS